MSLITRENVTYAPGYSCVHYTLKSVTHYTQTVTKIGGYRPASGKLVTSSLFTSACPLDTGAFKYNVRGSDTVKGCRRWGGTLTFSDIS